MKDVEEMKSTTFSGLHVSKRHQNTVGIITPEDTEVGNFRALPAQSSFFSQDHNAILEKTFSHKPRIHKPQL